MHRCVRLDLGPYAREMYIFGHFHDIAYQPSMDVCPSVCVCVCVQKYIFLNVPPCRGLTPMCPFLCWLFCCSQRCSFVYKTGLFSFYNSRILQIIYVLCLCGRAPNYVLKVKTSLNNRKMAGRNGDIQYYTICICIVYTSIYSEHSQTLLRRVVSELQNKYDIRERRKKKRTHSSTHRRLCGRQSTYACRMKQSSWNPYWRGPE